jgi:hypothetical protein
MWPLYVVSNVVLTRSGPGTTFAVSSSVIGSTKRRLGIERRERESADSSHSSHSFRD